MFKAAIGGGALVAAFNGIVIVGYHLFAKGTGEGLDEFWPHLFLSLRFYIGIPSFFLVGNMQFPKPFNNEFTDDLICVIANGLLGAMAFAILAALWQSFLKMAMKKRS